MAFIQLVLFFVLSFFWGFPSQAEEAPLPPDALRRVGHYCRFTAYGQNIQTRNNQMHVDGIRSDEPLFIKSVLGAEPTSEDASILIAIRELHTSPYTLVSSPQSCRRVDSRSRLFEAKLISKSSRETLLYLRVGETVEVECQELEIHVCAPGGR